MITKSDDHAEGVRFVYHEYDYQPYLDEVFVISGIIKVEASVISRRRTNYCFIIHCFMENIQKLLCEMQVDFICAF